jgi:hypothetical protein
LYDILLELRPELQDILLELRPELQDILLELRPESREILGLPDYGSCSDDCSSKRAERTRVFPDKGYEQRVVSLANYRHNYEHKNYLLAKRFIAKIEGACLESPRGRTPQRREIEDTREAGAGSGVTRGRVRKERGTQASSRDLYIQKVPSRAHPS